MWILRNSPPSARGEPAPFERDVGPSPTYQASQDAAGPPSVRLAGI